jgi:multiple sugar transport system ATP-binding protein
MRDGVIMQVADPLTLYRSPEHLFVAGFIGSPPMNLLTGHVVRRGPGLFFVEEPESGALTFLLPGRLEKLADRYVGRKIVLGVRPEHLSPTRSETGHLPVIFIVELAEPMGAESIIYLKTGRRSLVARVFGERLYQTGDQLEIYVNLEKAHLFDAETEGIIA